jgi:uncharacterized membrane protein YdjX (TVP38/TMEM64 family)
MMRLNKRAVAEVLLLALIIGALVYVLWAFDLFGLFTDRKRLLGFIREHRESAAFLFIGLQVLQVIAAPVPGEVSGFVGGLFFGPLWGIVFSTIGLTLGSWLAFGLARLLGRPLVELAVSAETIRRYDYVMKHKGMFLAFLMFLVPGFPKDILCYLLGLGHMSLRDFLVVSTSGRLLGTTLLTVGGAFFRDRRYGAFFTIVGISLVAIILALVYRDRIERWIRRMRAVQRLKATAERRRSREACPPDAGDSGVPKKS